MSASDDLNEFSLLDLFRTEVEIQAATMTSGLLALERDPGAIHRIEEVMRGAHSVKGAARIVNRDLGVRVAHAMEDCLIEAQRQKGSIPPERTDALLHGVDLLGRIANVPEAQIDDWNAEHLAEVNALLDLLSRPASSSPGRTSESFRNALSPAQQKGTDAVGSEAATATAAPPLLERIAEANKGADVRGLRVTAENLNRLLGVAGESLVASRWLNAFSAELLRFKRLQNELMQSLNSVRESLSAVELDEPLQEQLREIQNKAAACREMLVVRMEEFESFDRRHVNISERLYQEVLDCRMRPFADGVQGFPRMLRDAARALGKEVKLEIGGEATAVDREILERIESPLIHLLRNAVDHGIEPPEERRRSGKSSEGTVRLEARHSAGMLLIEVADDGRGIESSILRSAVVRKGLVNAETAAKLTDAELLEFLFLPGFTTKESVTEISGRGFGLDVVQTTAKAAGGSIRISSQPGHGTRFQLQLPITLSVLRSLLVEIAGEPYAFPLGRVTSAVKVAREKLESIEGREHFTFGGQQIGLVTAHQVLGLEESAAIDDELPVVVLGDKGPRYGLVVDRFLCERELIVRPLDPRLGKVKDISAAALMPDQTPALIIDVDDLLRSIENLVSGGRLANVRHDAAEAAGNIRKRVLVVDDSLTVRELERKILDGRGYEVEVAVDGMDAWNAVRTGHYDLVITDVDMPRLDGIELVSLVKKDPRLQALPMLIVSYKDREEDRRRGLDAGADYYLTKGNFHEEELLRAVADLIGESGE